MAKRTLRRDQEMSEELRGRPVGWGAPGLVVTQVQSGLGASQGPGHQEVPAPNISRVRVLAVAPVGVVFPAPVSTSPV